MTENTKDLVDLKDLMTVNTVIKAFKPMQSAVKILAELCENPKDAGASIVEVMTDKDSLTCYDNGSGFENPIAKCVTISHDLKSEKPDKTGVKGTGLNYSMGAIGARQVLIGTQSQSLGRQCYSLDYSKLFDVPRNTSIGEITSFGEIIDTTDERCIVLMEQLDAWLATCPDPKETGTIIKATGCDWGKYEDHKEFNSDQGRKWTHFCYILRHQLSKIEFYFNGKRKYAKGPDIGDHPCKYNNFFDILNKRERTFIMECPSNINDGEIKGTIKFMYSKDWGGGSAGCHGGINLIRLGRQMNKSTFKTKTWRNLFGIGYGYLVADLHVDANIDKILHVEENKEILSLDSIIHGYDFENELSNSLRPWLKEIKEFLDDENQQEEKDWKTEAVFTDAVKTDAIASLVRLGECTRREAEKQFSREFSLPDGSKIDMVREDSNGAPDVIYEMKINKETYKTGVDQLVRYIKLCSNKFGIVPKGRLTGPIEDDNIEGYIEELTSDFFIAGADGELHGLDIAFDHYTK